MRDLRGKTALVTAAAQGIGRATAERFAQNGARVIATDINEAGLAPLAAIDGIEVRPLDVLDYAAVQAAVKQLETVDILFNCAGIVHGGTVLDATFEEFAFAVDLNVTSMIRTIKAVLPGMLERGDGAIVNMSSVASSVKGVPNRFVYGTTKAAVIGLTKSLAAALGEHGIRVNAVAPGAVMTERQMRLWHTPESRAWSVSRQALHTDIAPDDIADAVLFLSAEDSRMITKQCLTVDGGAR